MNVSPTEAEESLAEIQKMMNRTRRSIASSGAHVSLIVTGIVWLFGFMATQFLAGNIVTYIWIGLSVLGGALGTVLGMRMSTRVRSPSITPAAKHISLIWLLLTVYCAAAIAVTWPLEGKQLTTLIVLFVMVGWLVMGLLISVYTVWIWQGLITIALVLMGYFLLPGIFYLWIALLGGGGMIALGVYIRTRW